MYRTHTHIVFAACQNGGDNDFYTITIGTCADGGNSDKGGSREYRYY